MRPAGRCCARQMLGQRRDASIATAGVLSMLAERFVSFASPASRTLIQRRALDNSCLLLTLEANHAAEPTPHMCVFRPKYTRIAQAAASPLPTLPTSHTRAPHSPALSFNLAGSFQLQVRVERACGARQLNRESAQSIKELIPTTPTHRAWPGSRDNGRRRAMQLQPEPRAP